MVVGDTDVDCARISSLFMFKNSLNYAEIGWYDGYGLTGCTGTSSPRLLVYGLYNGRIKCKPDTPFLIAGGNYDTFRLHDSDANYDWSYYWNGAYQGFYNLTFTTARAMTNGERWSSLDSAYAKFWGLQSMGFGGSWHDWNPQQCDDDNDVDYSLKYLSDTHHIVKLYLPGYMNNCL